MKNIRYSLFCIVLMSGLCLSGQQVIIKADTVVGIPGDSVTIPIRYYNLDDIASVTLYIQFNPGILNWGRALNWEAGFDNGFNFANVSGNTLAITCLNYNGFTSSQGKLLDLNFRYINGFTTSFTFTASCEITGIDGIPVSPAPLYLDGIVVKNLDVNVSATPSTICLGSSSQLNASANGLFGVYTYQWGASPAGFTSSLVNPVVSPLVSTRYFVTVTSGIYTDTASIVVSPVSPPVPGAVSSMLPLDGTTGLSNPVTLSWAPAADASSYDVFLWPTEGSPPTTPSFSDLLQISCHPGNLTQNTNYSWKVVAKNACTQTTGPVSTFTMLPYPELHVTQVSISAANPGQPLEVTWTVKNDGQGATTTPVWYDRIWVSPDIEVRVGEQEDILLGYFPNISYLAPGESYTQTRTVHLPPELYGTYYLFVVTDALDALFINFPGGTPQLPYSPPPFLIAYSHGGIAINVVKEVSDNGPYHDNFFYKEMNLTVPPLPDLKVINIVEPATIFSGQPIAVTWTVFNDGDASPLVNSWQDVVFLSPDSMYDSPDAFYLGTFLHEGLLPPDSLYTCTQTLTIPNYISGDYFIHVFTDFYDVIYEHVYDGNNVSRSDTLEIFLTPPPDLAVTEIDIPAVASVNEYVDLKFTVTNQGATATTTGMWRDRVVISPSPSGDLSQGYELATPARFYNLGSLESYTVQVHVQVPPDISGAWYIYVQTDIDSSVFEYNYENNNLSRSDTSIIILTSDLQIVNLIGPAVDSSDQLANFSWYEKNGGPGDLVNHHWVDYVYLSLNAVFDTANAILFDSSYYNISIPAGDSLPLQEGFYLPNINSGVYYLYIFTDRRNEVMEGDGEDNNVGRSAGTLEIRRADLAVQRISSEVIAQSGLPITVDVLISNTGTGQVLNKNLTDRVYLLPDTVFDASTALLLGTFTPLVSLSSGDSVSVQWEPLLPEGISGSYYLAYHTDYTNVVKEGSHEANNFFISPTPIEIVTGPWADLEPLSLTAPSSVTAGSSMNISYTIRNNGSKDAGNQQWQDRLYLLPAPEWDTANAILLKSVTHTVPLAAGSTYSVSYPVVLEPLTVAGTYYLFLRTDATNLVFENTDEGNNMTGPGTLVIAAYPLDLVLSEASVNTISLFSGQELQLSYSVTNSSPVSTVVQQWNDALFISTDTNWNSSEDILISEWIRQGPLTAWHTYDPNRLMNIPNGLSGTFYLFAVTDLSNANHDIFFTNNIRLLRNAQGQPVSLEITLTPPVDLYVKDFSAPLQAVSGQSFKVFYTIKNQGTGTAMESWKDRLYLSQDFEINSGDLVLKTNNHSVSLLPGQEYSDSMNVVINQNVTENFLLLFKTDAVDNVYENAAENNNTASSFLLVNPPPPADLVVEEVNCEPLASSGRSMTFSWVVKNIGQNTATGSLNDAVYLSTDTIYDPGDRLWSTHQNYISIPPQGSKVMNATRFVPGILPGYYHLIVRTDLTNTIPETNDNNNRSASLNEVYIDFPPIEPGVIKNDTLHDFENLYYKMLIPATLDGKSLILSLKGDSVYGTNEVYCSFEAVPSRIFHQFTYSFSFSGNQELVIPSVHPGTYYFLITGSTLAGDQQNISLLPEILTFKIRSITENKGGNSGNVTVRVSGSLFTPDMKLFLTKDTIALQAKQMLFIDPTTVIATFGLTYPVNWEDTMISTSMQGIPVGFYHVMARKSSGETAVLTEGFEVVQGTAPLLISTIQYPARVRPNRYFSMSIQFVNGGNTDMNIPIRTLISRFGAPIGLSTYDLIYNTPDLYLEFREPGGPPLVLRPGAVSEIKIYCKSTTDLVFKLLKN